MDLHIYGRNLAIDDTTREYVESKLNQIDSHLPGLTNATVELAHEPTRRQNDRIVAQVTLQVGKTILRAQQRAANTTTAINSVSQALDRQIKRFKSHTYRSERSRQMNRLGDYQIEASLAAVTAQGDSVDSPQIGVPPLEDRLDDGQVVRLKQFDMEPTSVDEAAAQMQFLGHSFFMFLDSETNMHSVLYQRGDGNIGMIQPKPE
ncbi:MAG: ribosome-associated translation inhibitor RaiA [Chloroflexi bacterium]|nr:ribosome-associated translation inhibitor RaiA [Chloroflexota bacterium]